MEKAIFTVTFLFVATLSYFQFDSPNKWVQRTPSSVNHHDYYMDKVKPVFDNRCVTCHSCYNAPCQLKLSSFEGFDRGVTKKSVYQAERLWAAKTTRLFEDAKTTKEWRKKGFADVRDTPNWKGVFSRMLDIKRDNPHAVGDFTNDAGTFSCPTKYEFSKKKSFKHTGKKNLYAKKKYIGMPYGFPALSEYEDTVLSDWIALGYPGPSKEADEKLKAMSSSGLSQVKKWEEFLNQESLKSQIVSRYIYEHLFLAHIYFKGNNSEFFRLVRSKTPSGQPVDEVPTRRPYDDPEVKIFYRFIKIHSTIVHKTHITYEFSKDKMNRYKDLFYSPKSWIAEPTEFPAYGQVASNPFKIYKELSPLSRYQFLLDDSHYHIMTFIRGPVCKGQVAVNVIRDHFHATFVKPQMDPTVTDENFLLSVLDDLDLPAEGEGSIKNARAKIFQNKHLEYSRKKFELWKTHFKDGVNTDIFWKGFDGLKRENYNYYNNQWLLTIFRHFDSSSVLRGHYGTTPQTVWLLDYPVFERIYYNLVAGFDVYGNLRHQISTRLYMDNLRVESEDNFMSLIPLENRVAYREKINKGALKTLNKRNKYFNSFLPSKVKFNTKSDYSQKDELVTMLYENYSRKNPKHINLGFMKDSSDNVTNTMKKFTHRRGEFVNFLPEVTLIYLKDTKRLFTLTHNVFHSNVNYLFGEDDRIEPDKDYISIVEGQMSSYPNLYLVTDSSKLDDMVNSLEAVTNKESFSKFLDNYGKRRMDDDFWIHHDLIQKSFNSYDDKTGGILDLIRYVNFE